MLMMTMMTVLMSAALDGDDDAWGKSISIAMTLMHPVW